jgi:hypothetical protein
MATNTIAEDAELKGALDSKDWASDHVENSSNIAALIPADEEKRLVRKMDLHIMPILVALYVMSFLDRVNIGECLQSSHNYTTPDMYA